MYETGCATAEMSRTVGYGMLNPFPENGLRPTELSRKWRSNSQTRELADAPVKPIRAADEAVNFMVGLIDELDTDEQLSLKVYGTTGLRHGASRDRGG